MMYFMLTQWFNSTNATYASSYTTDMIFKTLCNMPINRVEHVIKCRDNF